MIDALPHRAPLTPYPHRAVRFRCCIRPISRDLLSLEKNAPSVSPFLITPSAATGGAFPFPSLPSAGGKLKTFPMPPPSALLARVAAFLPQMAEANAKLTADIARAGGDTRPFDIETVEDEDAPHIEMNLDVGVLEMQKEGEHQAIRLPGRDSPLSFEAAAAAAAAASPFAGIAAEAASSDDEDEDEDESDDANSTAGQSIATTNTNDSTGSGPSRAAKKRSKYRARRRAANAATGTTESAPLPKCANPLIQEIQMEDD